LQRHHSIYKVLLLQNALLDALITAVFTARNMALIAIGGYGRRERCLYSDIDILFLADDEIALQNEQLLEFIDLLQALEVKSGYSVHTPVSLMEAARKDMHLLTSLIDMRFVCGSHRIYDYIHQQFIHKHGLPDRQTFLKAKYQEQLRRDQRFPINQQPDIKNTIGNLRYLHTIHWILNYADPSADYRDLLEQHIINEDEFDHLAAAHRFLNALRFYLHILYRRDENRLLIADQRQIAAFFGYDSDNAKAAIEGFMQHYYQCIRQVKFINRIVFSVLRHNFKAAVKRIDQTLYTQDSMLISKHENYPHKLKYILEPFVYFASREDISALSADICRNINRLLSAKNSSIEISARLSVQFLSLFHHPHKLRKTLSLMTDLGVLEVIIPEFGAAKGQMQFDLYHQYTVDRHTIEIIAELAAMRSGRAVDFPLTQTLMADYDKPELLYLAGLFHDIGKGSGQDHSEYGAAIAKKYMAKWSVATKDAELIVWLVKEHLLITRTIKKQDLDDSEVIAAFCRQLKNLHYLVSLVILTVADIKATDHRLWNNWQATLIGELYQKATACFQQNHSPKNILSHYQQLKQKLTKIDLNKMLPLWQRLPARYFKEQTLNILWWQTRCLLRHIDTEKALHVDGAYLKEEEKTIIFITGYCDQNPLCRITSILYDFGLNITGAQFFTAKDGRILYAFYVTDLEGISLHSIKIRRIAAKLTTMLQDDRRYYRHSNRSYLATIESRRIETKVNLYAEKDKPYTRIVIKTADRAGLLSDLCYFFQRESLIIVRAKILTLNQVAQDIFYVQNQHHEALTHVGNRQEIKEKLVQFLNKT
ncbi:MAG: [protein-PII] uridylyltransferase, partial [Francisellaceae bacterium]